MSFDPRVSAWFHQNAPTICAGLVMREDAYGHTQTREAREEAFYEAAPDFLGYHVAALANPWIGELRGGGLPVLTWTVNSPDARTTALEFADALISEGEGLA
jgi:glycerophosphoryl diester phosphodiesterase